MNRRVFCRCVVVCAVGALLTAGNARAQFGPQVKVSNAIEGSDNPPGVTAARCGNNVVVGFGDTEPSHPASTAGFAVSKDGGNTFTEGGTLTGSDPSFFVGGRGFLPAPMNSSVGCSSASTFYYVAPAFIQTESACAVGCVEITIFTSTNGGTTWSQPVVASAGTEDNHKDFFSPSFAIDPTNPKRMYIAYLNFNTAPADFADCTGGGDDTIILELVTSTDGGKTWNGRANPGEGGSPNMQLDHSCPSGGTDPARDGFLASPNVVVSPEGQVYVTYSFTGVAANIGFTGNQIRFRRSLDGGRTFSAPMIVSKDAINDALPQLAVDRTKSSFRGTIYLTWSGKPRGTTTEVLMSDSLNHGVSFSFPRSVRSTSEGTQVNPVVSVDNDGQVADCYYVTSTNTPTSSSKYFYNCLTSFNHAATWAGYQKLVPVAPPGFDAITSDFLLHNDGFFTAFELQNSSGQRRVVGEKADTN